METIFDYNPTKEELVTLFGAEITKERYEKLPQEANSANAEIYHLLKLRGDANADKYLAAITDTLYRNDVSMIDCLP